MCNEAQYYASILIKCLSLPLSLRQSYSLNLHHHQLYITIEIHLFIRAACAHPLSLSLSISLSLSLSFSVLSLLMLVNAEEKEEYHPLLYNINLYYNQSNSLRIKRDLSPSFQNKWSYVSSMHQYNILFNAQTEEV